jgi:two-component system sensor kinase FixL
MTFDTPPPLHRAPAAHSAEGLVRQLGRRYLLVLVAVAALVAADQAVIQPLLVRMNVFAPVINLAGRQRMLSQKLAKAALAMHATQDTVLQDQRRTELDGALDEWSTAHAALRGGSVKLNIPRIQSPDIDDAWSQLDPHFTAMHAAATVLLGGDADGAADAVASLVDHEAPFLVSMERIAALMEGEAAAELGRLRALAMGIAATILGLIVALGAFVVRPATAAIRQQVDELESRVKQRTRELNDALQSLRSETERREQTEYRNRSLAAELAHADRVESLGRLASGLAHELNQPLGAIANYAEACQVTLAGKSDERVAPQLRDHLHQINQAALRAGAIIRRIRNFVRPGMGNAAPVDMGALIGEVVDLCRAEAARSEIEIAVHLPVEPALVHADAIQIQQVLVNLVQNALQAMSAASPQRRRLTIGMATAHDSVQVDVTDSGPGLAGADAQALFKPFHTTKSDGLGIGLSICRSIIEHHQGTIWAKSLPSEGAQFSFILPLAAAHAELPVG